MSYPFKLQQGDMVELTVDRRIPEPAMNDGDTIVLKKGLKFEFIRFTNEGESVELRYVDNLPIRFEIPTAIIIPAKSEGK